MYRVNIQESKPDGLDGEEHYEPIFDGTLATKWITAQLLRAVADELDPPKRATRQI